MNILLYQTNGAKTKVKTTNVPFEMETHMQTTGPNLCVAILEWRSHYAPHYKQATQVGSVLCICVSIVKGMVVNFSSKEIATNTFHVKPTIISLSEIWWEQGISQRPVHPSFGRVDLILDKQIYRFCRCDILKIAVLQAMRTLS